MLGSIGDIDMKTLTKAKERQILKAAEQVVDLVNQGSSPSDALFKVASDEQLTPEFVKRLAETFNTSRILAHFKEASSEKRADEFPLASAADVLSRMYPDKVESDGVKEAKSTCHSTWFDPPPDFSEVPIEKAAIATVQLQPTADKKRALELLIKRAHNHTHALQRKVETATNDVDYCREILGESIKKAAQYFVSLEHVPFEAVESNVLTKYGSVAKHLMNAIFLACRGETLGEKRGSAHDSERIVQVDVEPYSHIDDALSRVRQWTNATAEKQAAEEEYDDFTTAMRNRIVTIEEINRDKVPFPFGDTPRHTKRAFSPVHSFPWLVGSSVAGSQINDTLDSASNADRFERRVQESVDPEQMTQLRSIRTKALLNELISSDPVISAYDPQTVLDAYNGISQMTPRVAETPGVLRSLLARQLELGQVDPFEAIQTLEMEDKLRDIEMGDTPPEWGGIGPNKSPSSPTPKLRRS